MKREPQFVAAAHAVIVFELWIVLEPSDGAVNLPLGYPYGNRSPILQLIVQLVVGEPSDQVPEIFKQPSHAVTLLTASARTFPRSNTALGRMAPWNTSFRPYGGSSKTR